MRQLLLFALLIMSISISAQKRYLAVINAAYCPSNEHASYYSDVTIGQSSKSQYVTRIWEDEIFYYSVTNTNWYKVYSTPEGKFLGYMPKNRIRRITATSQETKDAIIGKWYGRPQDWFEKAYVQFNNNGTGIISAWGGEGLYEGTFTYKINGIIIDLNITPREDKDYYCDKLQLMLTNDHLLKRLHYTNLNYPLHGLRKINKITT